MNTNQNIRNFGGSDTLMLSKINMDSSDARVLADLLKDNTTVTKVSADRVKRTRYLFAACHYVHAAIKLLHGFLST